MRQPPTTAALLKRSAGLLRTLSARQIDQAWAHARREPHYGTVNFKCIASQRLPARGHNLHQQLDDRMHDPRSVVTAQTLQHLVHGHN